MKKIIFKGSGVALVTPMKENGEVNFKELEKLIDFHLKNKTDAIIVFGTTGEGATLKDDEKKEIIKVTLNKVKGKIPVIAGTGSNSTKRAIELSKMAQNLGCSAVLVVTPFYNKTSQEGLYNHYKIISESLDLPIILYNVPSRTGMTISPETYLKLSKIKNIVATKEASGDISHIAKVISLCRDDLMVYSGNDDQTLPILALGGIGVISVFANIFPKEMHDINNLFFENKLDASKELFFKYLEVMNMLFCDINPIPVKEALNILGFNCGKCRLPLFNLNNENKEKLKLLLKDFAVRK